MNKAFLLLLAVSVGTAHAQDLQSILNNVSAAQKATRDVSFQLSGSATLDGAQSQKIDLNVQSIPASNVSRLVFNAPEALADNIIVVDGNQVRQYLYLTNQITVTTLGKAGAQRGADLSGLDFSQLSNLSTLKNRYDLKLLGATGAAGNRLYQIQASDKNGGTNKTLLWVSEKGWQPTRFQFLSGGKVMADVNVSNYKVNAGLNAAKLRALPKDAEIIKQ